MVLTLLEYGSCWMSSLPPQNAGNVKPAGPYTFVTLFAEKKLKFISVLESRMYSQTQAAVFRYGQIIVHIIN